jgi:perosamine synthetase
MRVQRTLPPAAAPLTLGDLLHGLDGTFHGEGYSRRLEAELREYFGARHVFLVSSGKAALTLILLALSRLSGRREVVLPAYTCFSVPAAVERAGLSLKLADVDPETLDFDYDSLGNAIGPDTLCVVCQHLFGVPADVERIQRLCDQTGAFLIEDAAQAMGARYRDQMVGSLADVGFFSLGRGKNITAGSGGIILTNRECIAEALREAYEELGIPTITTALGELVRLALMSILIRPTLYWLPAGLPFLRLGETRFELDFPIRRMSGMNAGILSNWRDRLTRANAIRVTIAAYLRAQLGFENAHGATIPYLRFPVMMDSRQARDRVHDLAMTRGLGVSRMYPTPINEIQEIKDRFAGRTFPFAKLIADRLLTLPTHHLVADSDRRSVCELLRYGEVGGAVNEAARTPRLGGAAGRRWT